MPRLIIDMDSFGAEKKLQGLLEAGQDLKPLLIRLGALAMREFDKNFRPRAGHRSGRTCTRRRSIAARSPGAAEILRDTGRLQQSLSQGSRATSIAWSPAADHRQQREVCRHPPVRRHGEVASAQ